MSLHTALIKIEERTISSEKAKSFIYSDKNGAESIFVGRVRNENDEVVNDNYKLKNKELISIIPPIGGG